MDAFQRFWLRGKTVQTRSRHGFARPVPRREPQPLTAEHAVRRRRQVAAPRLTEEKAIPCSISRPPRQSLRDPHGDLLTALRHGNDQSDGSGEELGEAASLREAPPPGHPPSSSWNRLDFPL